MSKLEAVSFRPRRAGGGETWHAVWPGNELTLCGFVAIDRVKWSRWDDENNRCRRSRNIVDYFEEMFGR